MNNLGNFPINTNYSYYNGSEEFSSGRNNFRGETTHRLDLGIQFHKKKKNNKVRTWGISLYNAYSRQNPFIYTLDDKYYDYNDPNATIEKELTRTSVLMLIPSINYNLKF